MRGLASGPYSQVHSRPGRVVRQHYLCYDPIRVDGREVLLVRSFTAVVFHVRLVGKTRCVQCCCKNFTDCCGSCRYLLFVFLTQMYFTFYGELPSKYSSWRCSSVGQR